jgi:hypothetical protein
VDAWLAGDGLIELQQEVDAIRAVSAADVQSVVQRWCVPEHRVEAITRGVPAT